MIFRSLILLLLLSAVQALPAQMFKPGMLITNEGDTLKGLVAVAGKTTFAIKKDKNGERNLYDVKELSAYEVNGDMYVKHVVEVLRGRFPERVEAYLRVVRSGPLNLLEYTGSSVLFGREHVSYYLHYDGVVPYRVNENGGNFRTTMRQYFSDYPMLAEKIRTKEMGYDQLDVIVAMYNNWYVLQPPLDDDSSKEESSAKEKTKREKKSRSDRNADKKQDPASENSSE